MFVHGGYWMGFDKSYWSHFARGAVDAGWICAIPSYDLCPDVRLGDIAHQIGQAISVLAHQHPGPIRLVGHSAGAQLVCRLASPSVTSAWQGRLEKVVAISVVSDLKPLLRTSMNTTLHLDMAQVQAESPVRLPPPDCPVVSLVGADERPAFLMQARKLSDVWRCPLRIEAGRHHFDVIDPLCRRDSPVCCLVVT